MVPGRGGSKGAMGALAPPLAYFFIFLDSFKKKAKIAPQDKVDEIRGVFILEEDSMVLYQSSAFNSTFMFAV